MGFNPTDDGFVLGYTKRVLLGEVPHRDFISIRPVGSALFHAPSILFGGRFTFLVDRCIVWFELAIMAWLWTALMLRGARARATYLQHLAIAAIGFALSAHTFPVMAWHTTDALFAATLGVVLCERRRWRWLGYALLGLAALCKQNFAVVGPLVILARGDLREWRAWVSMASLPAAYVAFVTYHRALPDLVEQLTAQSDLWTSGWKSFVTRPTMAWRFALGILLGAATFGRRIGHLVERRRALLVVLVTLGLFFEAAKIFEKHEDYSAHAFELFAVVAGIVAASIVSADDEFWRIGVVAVSLAWASSISMGYISPALASAPMVAVIAGATFRGLRGEAADATFGPRASSFAFALVAAAVVIRVDEAREQTVYRDLPVAKLHERIDDLFAGTKGLRTSVPMRAYLDDLSAAIAKAGDGEIAIVPDFAGYWVATRKRDPLVSVWPLNWELLTPGLIHRMLEQTDLRRGRTTIVVQKFATHAVATGGRESIVESYSLLATHVRATWKLVDSTANFDIYR